MDAPKRTLRIKAIYSPGLISLVLLPVLCIWFLHSREVFKQEAVMEIILFNPKMAPYYRLPKAEFAIFEFNENKTENKVKIEKGETLFREILKTEDTTKVLKFIFGKGSDYNSFVQILNFFYKTEGGNYLIHKNVAYFYYPPLLKKATSSPTIQLENFRLCTVIPVERHKEDFKLFEFLLEKFEYSRKIFLNYWISCVLYMGLVCIAVYKAFKY